LGQVWAGCFLHGEAVQVSRGGEHQGEHGQGAQAAHQRGYDHRGESILYTIPLESLIAIFIIGQVPVRRGGQFYIDNFKAIDLSKQIYLR